MGRAYAGIMGSVAFAALVARGLIQGDGAESTFKAACLGLLAFAALGCLIGWTAGWIVDDSVRGRLQGQRTAQRADRSPQAPGSA